MERGRKDEKWRRVKGMHRKEGRKMKEKKGGRVNKLKERKEKRNITKERTRRKKGGRGIHGSAHDTLLQ